MDKSALVVAGNEEASMPTRRGETNRADARPGARLHASRRTERHQQDGLTDRVAGHRLAQHEMDRSEWSLNPQVPGSNPGGRTKSMQVTGLRLSSFVSWRSRRAPAVAERFEAKVQPSSSHHLWTGSTDTTGVGHIRINGLLAERKQRMTDRAVPA
jgi:hypothetical protein